MMCCLSFSVKDKCGEKFDCMFCLEVLIYGVRRFIYSLFHMGWWRFGKVRVIMHLYFQGFIQGVDDGYVLIVKVLLIWGVQRVSYPMMVRRQPRLAKQSQYCLMRDMMRSQISRVKFGLICRLFQVQLGQSPRCKGSCQYACD